MPDHRPRGAPPLSVAPFRARRAGLVQTQLPGTKPAFWTRPSSAFGNGWRRSEARLPKPPSSTTNSCAVATALERQWEARPRPASRHGSLRYCRSSRRRPSAVTALGGRIVHYGMPVDPGNLLLIARLKETAVVVLPGCARSPKLNGFDRCAAPIAGLDIGRADIMAMGVGGLLMEIPSRPSPRERRMPPAIAIGRATGDCRDRACGGPRNSDGLQNKLLVNVGGRPLIAAAVEGAVASGLAPVVVVVGHLSDAVRAALGGLARHYRREYELPGRPERFRSGPVSPPCRPVLMAWLLCWEICRRFGQATYIRWFPPSKLRGGPRSAFQHTPASGAILCCGAPTICQT